MYETIILFMLLPGCNSATSEFSRNQQQSSISTISVDDTLDTAAVIAQIRQQFRQTNDSLKDYRAEEQKALGVLSEGGSMMKYYQGDRLKKIETAYYGSMGKSLIDYYINQDRIYFIFRRDYEYDKPMYMEGSQVQETRENRYYFNEGRLIRWIDEIQELVPSSSSKFADKERELTNTEVFSSVF